MTAHQAVIALGSNLANPLAALQRGLDLLSSHREVDLVVVSPVYETDPAGGPAGQSAYLNAVALAATSLAPQALLTLLHRVEATCGRVRGVHWGPRTLDLDLIWYDDLVLDEPELTLPHPRAHERGFVVQPWLAIDPEAALPGRGPLAGLPAAVPTPTVRRVDQVLTLPVTAAR